MSRDLFLVDGPACISFSGGRTSGYMLWRILQAHGGTLPDDVKVVFANTGKEMPQTLDFVQECSERWDVPIVWVEYRARTGDEQFAVVNHATASRNGEPLAAVIEHRKYLPNPVARFCTVETKVRTMHRYLRSIGWTEWTSCVGIRADEPRRVAKIKNQDYGKHEERCAPLADAGIGVETVGEFWRASPFDLQLPNNGGKTMHGNCDLCFLKGGNQVMALIREEPARAIWWIEQERRTSELGAKTGATFRSDRPSYAAMYEMATKHGELFAFNDEPLADCACTD